MKNRKSTAASGRRQRERGAALILAIAIMTILLAIGLTFYVISREEVKNADNVKNRVQADLLIDSALAIAMAEINNNFSLHPEATSLDHAMFSKFNGSWAVGKEWALWKYNGVNALPLQGQDTDGDGALEYGIPQVNVADMPYFELTGPGGTYREQLYNGPLSREWLYYPRFENDRNYVYGTPAGFGNVTALDFYTDATGFVNFTNFQDGSPFIGQAFDITARFDFPPGNVTPLFVTPAYYGPSATDGFIDERYPIEWINTWTDVDNDGDGLKDAIYIPLGRELYFSGGPRDDVTNLPRNNDGTDNNLNGLVDESNDNGLDDDGDGFFDFTASAADIDEQMELATFVYDGKNDGIDNDGDGLVDGADADESAGSPNEGYFLTTPLPGLTIPVDLNADGVVPDYVPDGATGRMVVFSVTLPAAINVATASGPVTLTAAHVDSVDNDYDMLVNDYHVYAYVGPNTVAGYPPFGLTGFEDTGEVYPDNFNPPFTAGDPIIHSLEANAQNSQAGAGFYSGAWQFPGNWFGNDFSIFSTARQKAYEEINVDTAFGGSGSLNVFPARSDFWSESLVGTDFIDYTAIRPFIRITHSGEPVCELAGRAAITIRDEASGLNMNVAGGHTYEPFLGDIRSLGDGATAAELDTRILPLIVAVESENMWKLLNGKAKGIAPGVEYNDDTYFPGYGRVDDNANLLLAALDNKDNDGDGLIDEGLRLPPLNDPLFDEYYAGAGRLEGIDEPDERQRFRPLPNLQAEARNPYNITGFTDGADNDGDGVVNQRGELGDLQLKDTLDMKLADGIDDARFAYMRHSISLYSTDRNTNFVRGASGIRAVNKLDYNFATPQQIAANLLLSNSYQVSTSRADVFPALDAAETFFANGLLQGDTHIRASLDGLMDGYVVPGLPADGVLQAMQAAVDIVDNRDRLHGRSVLTTERTRILPASLSTGAAAYDSFPLSLGLRERIPDRDLFPLEEIQDHLRDAMDVNRRLEFNDDWWTYTAGVAGFGPLDDGDVSQPEQRKISYTVTGNEAVRINEIMVRPVRRVEAETVPPLFPAVGNDPMAGAANIVNYDPQGGYPQLPLFEVDRLQSDIDLNPATNFWTLQTNGYIGEGAWLESSTVEEVVQFRIRASEGLPPGRYYLVANIRGSIGALNPTDLEYAIKYGPNDILSDLPGVPFAQPAAVHYSEVVDGAPFGSVFLNGTDGLDPTLDDYFSDGGIFDATILPFPGDTRFGHPNSANQTFTVTVSATEDLYIAIRIAPGAAPVPTLQIDSLDFSQEPDHEWVELVNESNEIVDISNWELEVGIPDRDAVPDDPFKSRWKIPSGSRIAPGGMVLLAVNKFDYFKDGGDVSRIFDNGMGLADGNITTGELLADTSGFLTVPTVFDDSSPFSLNPDLFDSTGSVFYRDETEPGKGLVDYVDRDGDGRSSYAASLDTDNVAGENQVASSELGSFLTNAVRAFDRIIQLDPESTVGTTNSYSPSPDDFLLSFVGTVDDVAAFVLRGGVFPNYPEHDNIDNDGDGGYFDGAGFYIPGTLELDMVDNNLDGLIDERGVLDPLFPADYSPVRNSEGVDEGNILFDTDGAGNPWTGGTLWRPYGVGSYEPVTLPNVIFNDRSNYFVPAYTVNFDGVRGVAMDAQAAGVPVDMYMEAVSSLPIAFPSLVDAPYLGSVNDPPEWRAFAERRWNPGDNVIVTLYQGSESSGIVVDRVTYTESDVINRTIDDQVPYMVDTINDGARDTNLSINGNFPTLWLPNQMGLDFYRSLERKHPLYNGDRFGTENRWQATDGNYDDWSESLSYFESERETDLDAAQGLLMVWHNTGPGLPSLRTDVRPRFGVGPDPDRQDRLYGHAMAGSPLRMNTAARISENPPDLERYEAGIPDPTQFFGAWSYYRTFADGDYGATGTVSQQNQTWNHQKTLVANRPYQSPGDLMQVPHQMYLHDAVNTFNNLGAANAYLSGMNSVNVGLEGDSPLLASYHQDIALRGATLGQDDADQGGSGNLLRESINSMARDSVVMTMGQAEFHPIHPDLAPGDAQNANALDWVPNPLGSAADDLWAPATWAPIFLFELPNDNAARSSVEYFPNYPSYDTGVNINELIPRHYLFDADYMFNNVGAPFYNMAATLPDRWNLESRVAAYVSQNRPVLGATLRRPEALWIWDGADGLENGEYMLYVGTFLPNMADRIEDAASASFNGVTFADPSFNLPAKGTPLLLANSGVTTTYDLRDGTAVVMDQVTASFLRRDPTSSNPYYGAGQRFAPKYAIDVITDPTEARGRAPLQSTVADPSTKPPGLIHPDDWNPSTLFEANDDGYIFYGNNASGGWRPQVVRVTDNFLALRVRNVGSEAELGALTHIVLAPRKRTAGRLNVNTAQSRIVPQAGDTLHEYVSPLLGLPGVVDVARTVVPSDAPAGSFPVPVALPLDAADDVSLMDLNVIPGGPWAAPASLYNGWAPSLPPARNFRTADVFNPDTDLLVLALAGAESDRHRIGAFRMDIMMMAGRTEHADGRYYESVGDMVLDSSAYDYDYTYQRADTPDFTGTGTIQTPDGLENAAVYPLSNDSVPSKRFDEVYERFRRMGNIVTTRSDVYEIMMTVESGYGVDANGDGIVNYRDPNEFITSAQAKATAIYERRTPSDESDGGE